jgi:Domain of unknown function (DUF4440)
VYEPTVDLMTAERRLQAAQLAADADALDELIDERLVFTGPDGRLYSKQDDLEIQRSGQQRLTRVDAEDVRALVDGDTGVTWFLGTVAGVFLGDEFSQRVRYTRTWIRSDEHGWRLLAAHVSPA